MENAIDAKSGRSSKWFAAATLLLALLWQGQAQAVLTVNVLKPDGTPVGPVGFRALVEEDTTHPVTPGALVSDSLSLDVHRSYAPVAAKGASAGNTLNIDVPADKRYFVSVLPNSGYTIGGAQVAVGQTAVNVIVQPLPLPTAQISVLVFHDNAPINNVPEPPLEVGLPGFTIAVFEAAGRYGQAGGQVSQDAFGNPLGTTYAKDPNDPTGETFLYNPDGTPQIQTPGAGIIKTNDQGEALIKYLPPGKYGIQAVPPAGAGWIQTSTIEGTKTIDAWVKPKEPPVFVEFGPPGQHVFIGFVKQFADAAALDGTTSISGTIVNLHNSRPPDFTFHAGEPLPNCWVGLNEVGTATGVYAAPCNADSSFTIPNVPPGSYQLVMWDTYLDNIFALYGVTVNEDGTCNTPAVSCNLGNVPVFRWFGRLENFVFLDRNENGFRDCVTLACNDPAVDDVGIPEQAVNLRFRDGTLYQSFPTDTSGYVPFDEVFPFFKFLVTEVDFLRFKATGATFITDNGGPVLADNGWAYPSRDKLTPQPQFCTADDVAAGVAGCLAAGDPLVNPNTGNNLSRTVTGPLLTQAMQTFLGTNNVIEWGKAAYGPAENGGISGIVHYSTTRAENDPRYAAAEDWEPGIPRVQVNLYLDANADGVIDDLNGNGVTLADVDNHPFGWADGSAPKGPEDVDRNGNGAFEAGDAVQIATSDSWDDNLPTGCPGAPFLVHGGQAQECFEGLRTYNQMRDGVFDGGYAFNTYFPGGVAAPTGPESPLAAGTYIVEAVTPPGYEHVKEEDKNVDFGDAYEPSPLLLPPVCVGDPHLVPPFLSLFPGVSTAYAGQTHPLCDRKQIALHTGANAAVDFNMFTEVPKAGRIVGIIVDDTANEFDPNSPSFGEKWAPPWLPVSIRDWTGKEISRVYSDEWGSYNALVPSTYTVNVPSPSGVSPNMLTVCLNSPTMPDPADPTKVIADPFFNRQYSQFCYTFQYMPGVTTYLDTPVLPIAAFPGPDQFALDCELPTITPVIYSVSGPALPGGPYVPTPLTGTQQITIVSAGTVQVQNPAYDGTTATTKTIPRDYGFGTVTGSVSLGGTALSVTGWNNDTITATVPTGTTTGQLTVTRGDNGRQAASGVTVTIGGPVPKHVPPGGSIQAVIDAATPGDLILVPPGKYEELVVLWKNVALQGWGAGSTMINAVKAPAEKLIAWRTKVNGLVTSGAVDLLPGQTAGLGLPEPALFNTEEGPGIIVLAKNGAAGAARIDGFTITGADHGGGIFVNGYADNLQVSNNRVVGNQGTYGGGVRLGEPLLVDADGGFVSGSNDNVVIHHNQITQNGALAGAGGGVALYTGSSNYQVTQNFICGNFSAGDAGGIGHFGLSGGGLIANNTLLFNHTFQQTAAAGGSGGGIMVAGRPGAPSPGSGSVSIVSNLIQGNLAGAGDGGGILLRNVNGQDALASPANPAGWYGVDVLNNLIVNNVSGLAGAVTLQDALKVNIVNNTIANNDSTATASAAFTAGPSVSTPQPAGVVGRAHSATFNGAGGAAGTYSSPALTNNIIWHNRSFNWDGSLLPAGGLVPPPATPVYRDLAVLGTGGQLNPQYSILTDATGYAASNITGSDPLGFVLEYFNGERSQIVIPEVTTAIQTAPAFDEGGNFIDVRFGPLTLTGNYHLTSGTAAQNAGSAAVLAAYPRLAQDIDGDSRPTGPGVDIGADEVQTTTPIAIDTDKDGVEDAQDNCTLIANASQTDSNGDGFGNMCDADFNNDGATNIADLAQLRAAMGSSIGQAKYRADLDLDSNAVINLGDMTIFKLLNGKAPGPAGVVP